MTNQLAIIETMSPQEIFNGRNIESILSKVAEEVRTEESDISTDKGRKEIASRAYKIARSKTFLDDLGKKLGEDAQAKLNAINSERKKCREFLDSLKDEIRKPLTEWEQSEKRRVENHEREILKIKELGLSAELNWQTMGQSQIQSSILEIESCDRDWEEFEGRSKTEITAALQKLGKSLDALARFEAERAELARLRAAEAERIQKEREERIAKDAAERARIEAEARADAEAKRIAAAAEQENQRVIGEKIDAEQRAARILAEKEASERRAQEAAVRAEAEKTRAVEQERLRIERERQAALAAEQARENNRKHVAKINRSVLDALVLVGAPDELGKAIVTAIATGKIPHTKIQY